MSKARYDFNLKSFGLFGGLVCLTAFVVTLLYGAIFGFDYLSQELSGASRVMFAAFNRPAVSAVPQQTFGPGHLQNQGNPVAAPYGQQIHPQQMAAPMTAPAAGQYLCPQHGNVGFPLFDGQGVARCPIGGQVMWLNQGGP